MRPSTTSLGVTHAPAPTSRPIDSPDVYDGASAGLVRIQPSPALASIVSPQRRGLVAGGPEVVASDGVEVVASDGVEVVASDGVELAAGSGVVDDCAGSVAGCAAAIAGASEASTTMHARARLLG